jgi:hypothetical protein
MQNRDSAQDFHITVGQSAIRLQGCLEVVALGCESFCRRLELGLQRPLPRRGQNPGENLLLFAEHTRGGDPDVHHELGIRYPPDLL